MQRGEKSSKILFKPLKINHFIQDSVKQTMLNDLLNWNSRPTLADNKDLVTQL